MHVYVAKDGRDEVFLAPYGFLSNPCRADKSCLQSGTSDGIATAT